MIYEILMLFCEGVEAARMKAMGGGWEILGEPF